MINEKQEDDNDNFFYMYYFRNQLVDLLRKKSRLGEGDD